MVPVLKLCWHRVWLWHNEVERRISLSVDVYDLSSHCSCASSLDCVAIIVPFVRCVCVCVCVCACDISIVEAPFWELAVTEEYVSGAGGLNNCVTEYRFLSDGDIASRAFYSWIAVNVCLGVQQRAFISFVQIHFVHVFGWCLIRTFSIGNNIMFAIVNNCDQLSCDVYFWLKYRLRAL